MAEFQKGIRLGERTSYRIGGEAEFFCEARTAEEVREALRAWRGFARHASGASRPLRETLYILGGGTNVLFPDEGFEGLVLVPALAEIRERGERRYEVGAGTPIGEVVRYTAERGSRGFEWAGGLPGTFGGAVRGNAGAFGGEMKDSIVEVTSIAIDRPDELIVRRVEECGFGYRSSIFKVSPNEIILGAVVHCSEGDPEELLAAAEEKVRYRRERQPLEYPNAGSTFKNVDFTLFPEAVRAEVEHKVKTDPFPVVPTAYLIDMAGLKGVRRGGAMISTKQPSFIVNIDTATADDVRSLIELAQREVFARFGVQLEEEICLVDSARKRFRA